MKSEDHIHLPNPFEYGCKYLKTIPDDAFEHLENSVHLELKEEDILIYIMENSTSCLARDCAAEKLQNLCKQG